jgi:GxxExxY protein
MLIKTESQPLEEKIIGYGIVVHRALGPGLLESIYESALSIELRDAGIPFSRQLSIPLYYKGELLGEHRPDLIVANSVVVEIKSIERLAPIHTCQMVTYLQITGLHVGLIMNFNNPVLKDGIKRVLV